MARVRLGDELELLVRGRRHSGWQAIRLEMQLAAASSHFNVALFDRDPLPIEAGDEVWVLVADELVLTGHVDDVDHTGSKNARQFRVAGRDRAADLVDSSELTDPGEWIDVGLSDLVRLIAEPFGVEVADRLEEAPEPFDRFARQTGETAWRALERACRLRGVLVHSGSDGSLVLERPGAERAGVELQEGRNVLRYRVRESIRERFSRYVVRGQTSGTDEFFGEEAALVEGNVFDGRVGRYRPLLVLAEGPITFAGAVDRAQWEATTRAARAARATIKTPGFRKGPGMGVWRPNQVVPVTIFGAGLFQDLLVDTVVMERTLDGGSVSTLGLVRKDAYNPKPQVDASQDLGFGRRSR